MPLTQFRKRTFASKPRRQQAAIFVALAIGAQLSGLAFADTPVQPVRSVVQTGSYVPARMLDLQQRGNVKDVFLDQRRSFHTHPYESTGYAAEAGETLTIRYTPFGAGKPNVSPELWIMPIYRANDAKYQGKPYEGANQVERLKEGLNTITVNHAGTINFAAPNEPFGGKIQVEIVKGGRPIPHFVLGKNQNADWAKMLAEFPDAPYGELVGKRMSVAMPLDTLKQVVDDPTLLLSTWDRIVDAAEEQYGLSDQNARPHEATPFTYQFSTKPDSTGGYMSASNYWLRTNVSGARDAANAATLTKKGWGPWHELGHHYQLPAITWGDQVEVTVNLTSLYVQRMLGVKSDLETYNVWSRVFSYLAQAERRYDSVQDLFVRVAMYWQLDLAFGHDFYARFGALVRAMPHADLPHTDAAKKQFLILQASRVSGHDLSPFFEKWGLAPDAETKRKLGTLGLKSLDKPIWENRDSAIKYTYTAAEQNIAGKVDVPADVRAGSTFVAKVDIGNRDAAKLNYEWHVPEGFTAEASNSPQITLRAPRNVLQNGSAPIRVTVSDGKESMPLGSYVKLKTDGPPLSAAQAFEHILLAQHGKSEALRWNDSQPAKGTPGNIYVQANSHRGTIDYFRLKTSSFWYFPLNHDSNSYWEYLGSFDGTQYLAGPEPEPVSEPVVHAGEDRTVVATSNAWFVYPLDGSRSSDPSGQDLTYQWRVVSGPFSLRKDNEAKAEAIVPKNVTGQGVYELTVTNKEGVAARATTRITAVAPAVTLNGSKHVIGEQVANYAAKANFNQATYTWTLANAAGKQLATGSGDNWNLPSSIASGGYTLAVRAHSSRGERSATAQQTVKVERAVAPKPIEAKITGPAEAEAGTRVELSAEASRNPNGTPLQYHWIVSPELGNDTATARVRLHVPIGAKAGTRYPVKLTVYDSQNKLSNTAEYTLTVKASVKPAPEPVPGPDAYPAYQAGTVYRGGDHVLNNGRIYECKPFPYSGWCGQAPHAYEPGKGWAWRDAWVEKQ